MLTDLIDWFVGDHAERWESVMFVCLRVVCFCCVYVCIISRLHIHKKFFWPWSCFVLLFFADFTAFYTFLLFLCGQKFAAYASLLVSGVCALLCWSCCQFSLVCTCIFTFCCFPQFFVSFLFCFPAKLVLFVCCQIKAFCFASSAGLVGFFALFVLLSLTEGVV